MPEENKDLVRRLVQGWQHEHRSEVAEELRTGRRRPPGRGDVTAGGLRPVLVVAPAKDAGDS